MIKKLLLFCSVVLVWGGLSAQPHIQQIQDAAGANFVQHSVAAFSNDSYVVAGTVTPGPLSGQSDILVMLVRIDGTILWARYVDYGQDEFAGSVYVRPGSEIVLTGYTGVNNTPSKRLIVVRLDSGGNPAGDMVIQDPGLGYGMYGTDVEQTNDGHYIIVGTGVQAPNATASKYAFTLQVNNGLNTVMWSRIYQSAGGSTEYDSFNHILKVTNSPTTPSGEAYLLTGSGTTGGGSQMVVNDLIDPNPPGSSVWPSGAVSYTGGYPHIGKQGLYDDINDDFYVLHNGFRYQSCIAQISGSGSLNTTTWGVIDGLSNLISGMEWSNPGNTEITFSGYNVSGSAGRPLLMSLDISSGTPSLLWEYFYAPSFDATAYQSVPMDYMVEPLHSFPLGHVNQHYYQPKTLVRDAGYNFTAPRDNSGPFSLNFPNTDINGTGIDPGCMQNGGRSIDAFQVNSVTPPVSSPYSFALTSPQPTVTVTSTNPTGGLFCVLSPSPSPSPATGAKPQNGLPDEVNLNLYPNPVADQLYLQGFSDAMENATISLYDMTGRQVLQQQQQKGNTQAQVSVASLPSGVYFVKVHTTNGALIFQERIVKE